MLMMKSRESLCNILGFRSTPNLGKYLGFPIQHKNSTSWDFDFILEKVHKKIQGWKANLLSMAGRLMLTKAVLSAIPLTPCKGAFCQVESMQIWIRFTRTSYGGLLMRRKNSMVQLFVNRARNGPLAITTNCPFGRTNG